MTLYTHTHTHTLGSLTKKKLAVIAGILLLISSVILVIIGINSRKDKTIQKTIYSSEIARAMTYAQVADGDEATNSEYVKFDAFFLRDLDGDGYAESLRGSCRKIGESDTLYMELKVDGNGYLENGVITINGNNFYLQTALPRDTEIKDNVIGNNIKEIKLNNIKNGTQKLLTGFVRSGDYEKTYSKTEAIGNNINNYSRLNSVTLTGTHIAEDGTETEINKTVEFNIDWHGTTKATINSTNQRKTINNMINTESNTIDLIYTIYTEEKGELILKRNNVKGIIPKLNQYDPINVEYTGKNAQFTYNEETREFDIDREVTVKENGTVTNLIPRKNEYNIKVSYPIEAYESMGSSTIETKMGVSTYFEGFNNTNSEFNNPYKSNVEEATIITTFIKQTNETKARFEITVGEVILKPVKRKIISKEKPLQVYNEISEPQDDDTYIVNWYGATGTEGDSDGMIMKETIDGQKQVADQLIKENRTEISMENMVSNVGIYFSNPVNMLGEDGWIKIYDEETNELLVTFTKENWSNYNSYKPYNYEIPVKHIKIETSKTNKNSEFNVYNIKRLDDKYITENFTKEEFDSLKFIESTLVGYLGGKLINADIDNAKYEAPYTIVKTNISKDTLSTQETEKNIEIKIIADADEQYNQQKWKNGVFLVKLPAEIITAKINNLNATNGVKIISYEQIKQDGANFIKINTESNIPIEFELTINCDLTSDPRIATTRGTIQIYAYNENGIDYWVKKVDEYDINDNLNTNEMVGYESVAINLIAPNSLLTNQNITNYDNKDSIAIAPQVAVVSKERSTADINILIKNNYSSTISDVTILGRIPFKENKYVINQENLGSTFTTTMNNTGIRVPKELEGKIIIYYSENENATKDLNDINNNWTTTPSDFSKVKSYLIDISQYTLQKEESHTFTYTVNIPQGINYNQITYGHHAIYFTLNTAEGKYKTQTEPNKVGLMIAKQYNLEITKYHKQKEKVVSGATYSITEQGQEETSTKVTNASGKLTLENLYVDRTYIIKEIKSPINYELNQEEIKFKVTEENGTLKLSEITGTVKNTNIIQAEEGQDYKLVIEVEDEIKSNLKIIKTEQGTENRLKATRFKITGHGLPENGKVLFTNTNGEINLNGLSIGKEYTLEEIQATEGYHLNLQPIKFIVTNDSGVYSLNIIEGTIKEKSIAEIEDIPTINLSLENEKIPTYNLQINKVIKGETTPLSGAKFRLYKGIEKIGDYTSDDNGIITINNLYQYEQAKNVDQTYTLKELSAPEGYSAVKDITFQVSKNAENTLNIEIKEGKIKEHQINGETVIIVIEDSPSFKLIKKDGETGEILPNTKFAIYNVDNGAEELAVDNKNNIIGTKEIINGKEYYTLTTNEKGEIEANLREGLYKAVEIQASDNKYDITDNEYYFGIGASREIETILSEEWIKNVGGKDSDYIDSVAIAPDGSYVAGGYFSSREIKIENEKITNNGYTDGIIIKYDENGKFKWVKSIGGTNSDIIDSVISTSDGNIVAVGNFYSNTIQIGEHTLTNGNVGSSSGMIVMLNSEGNVEWAKDISGNGNDAISSVIETNDGGLIAAGTFNSSKIEIGTNTLTNNGASDGMIIKYTKTGDVEWAKSIGGSSSDSINSITATKDGGCIIGGNFNKEIELGEKTLSSNGSNDAMIVKYNSTGDIEWATSFGGEYSEIINSIETTADGGVIVGGSFSSTIMYIGEYTLTSSIGTNGMLVKYNKNGDVEWASKINGAINSIAETKDGGYITGGYFSNTIKVGEETLTNKGGKDGLLVKYDNKGRPEKVKAISGENNDNITSVAVISSGSYIIGGDVCSEIIEIGGQSIICNGSNEGIIIKYNETEISNATTMEITSLGGNSNDCINSIVNTSDGGYIAGGYFQSNSITVGNETFANNGSTDAILIKYNKKGKEEWATSFGGMNADAITAVIETKDRGYIVGGNFNNTIQVGNYTLRTNGLNDAMIIKYNEEGKVEWATSFGGFGSEYITSIKPTSDEGFLVGGYFNSNNIQIESKTLQSKGSNDGLIIKYNKEGKVEWADTYGDSNSDQIYSVAETNDEYIAVGYFNSKTVQIGEKNITNKGLNDGIIIKYTKTGEVKSVTQLGESKHDYINTIANTNDGGYVIGGYFYSSNILVGEYELINKNANNANGMIIKYNKDGVEEWVATFDGGSSDYVLEIKGTKDGGCIVGGYTYSDTIKIGSYEITSNGLYEGIAIKYNKNGKVDWVKGIGGEGNDYIRTVTEIEDGSYILGGEYKSSAIESDGKTANNNGESDGMIIKAVNYTGVPEVEELLVENTRKEFKITTDIEEINGIKGGSISGEDTEPYEKVKYGNTNTKEIIMTPDENYIIIGITVNNEEYPFTAQADGTYIMPQFTNIQENKHIVVTYSKKDNKIVINKIDSKTKQPIQGVKFKIDQIQEESTELYHTEITTNGQGQAITQIPLGRYTITEVTDLEGYQPLEKPITIDFKENEKTIVENLNKSNATVNADGEYILENIPKIKVTVHHYLKDREGNYTTTKLAEDDTIYKNTNENYTTTPHLNIEKCELEKDINGQYVIPTNATGTVKENDIEVFYYYEERKIPLIVHHYIEGTSTPVPLANGANAEDVISSGYEGEKYTTNEIKDDELSDEYELLEKPNNSSGIYKEEIEVTYYYKKVSRPIHIKKYAEDGITPLAGAKFTITKVEENKTEDTKDTIYTTNENGKIKISLEAGEYEITEIKAPEGYVLPENPTINVVITKETTEKNIDITNDKIKGTVIVHHYIKGLDTPVKLQDGTYAKDETKQGYIGDIYATKQLENIANEYDYHSVIGETSGEYINGTIEITYYYQEKLDIDVTKKWNHTNNIYGSPENITIELYADGEKIDEKIMTKENKVVIEGEPATEETWKYTFERLPKYTDDGMEIEYTVSEKK